MNNSNRVTPTQRLFALRHSIDKKDFIRIIEAHSGLSAIVAETANVVVGGKTREYDGIWESSLTDSATKGLPDASIIGYESRLHTIDEILNVTSKPMIMDGDTGGEIPQFEYLVRHLERKGVSAVIIEDKIFPKRNSLDAKADQELEDPDRFALKIEAGKNAAISNDFMVIARLESLIAGVGLEDAWLRMGKYIDAGADGIMIHSNRENPKDLFEFVKRYNSMNRNNQNKLVLVSVPTTYNRYSDNDLASLGFNVVIHANHLLRASHKAMSRVANIILETGSSYEADGLSTPTKEIFQVVGFDRITASDRERNEILRVPTIIPAAGRDKVFPEGPKSLIQIAGRTLLDYQIESVHKAGLKQVVVVRGYEKDQFDGYASDENLLFCENQLYKERHVEHSVMQAVNYMDNGFAMVYSDILFDPAILNRLVNSVKDIVIGVDSSYAYHRHATDKDLDLVVRRKDFDGRFRSLNEETEVEIARVGRRITPNQADYEFIGMAYFSGAGAKILRDVHRDAVARDETKFHEAQSFGLADLTDILQEIIERGYPVYGIEVNKGWREIHTIDDIESAETEMALINRGTYSDDN